MPLALDKSCAGLTLGVERVEVLLQPLFGGFTGIDRAPAERLFRPHRQNLQCLAIGLPEPEEGRPVPTGAGDQARDLREAAIAPVAIGEPIRQNGDAMGLAAPLPFQTHAG